MQIRLTRKGRFVGHAGLVVSSLVIVTASILWFAIDTGLADAVFEWVRGQTWVHDITARQVQCIGIIVPLVLLAAIYRRRAFLAVVGKTVQIALAGGIIFGAAYGIRSCGEYMGEATRQQAASRPPTPPPQNQPEVSPNIEALRMAVQAIHHPNTPINELPK